MKKTLLTLIILLAAATAGHAQFYLAGDDPGHLRWRSIESAHYRIIYPVGADSLAYQYGRALEQFRVPVGRSLDMTPGKGLRGKTPVVLHTHNTYSNGSMGWAPRRMDLFTLQEPYGSDPIPWYLQLTSHEPRHQAQMQFGAGSFLTWLTGQAWAPVAWQLYLERAIGEGDAVAVETGLAGGTRARTADFLNYYRVVLDQGDYRSWDRWRYGSYKHFTPDLYTLGYVTVAGARYLYDDPMIVREAMDVSGKKPWMIGPYNTQKVIKQHSGKKFKAAFRDIQQAFNDVWQADAAARAPFMPLEQVTRKADFALEYSSLQASPNGLLALRTSNLRPAELVLIRDGQVRRLRSFASHTSSIEYEESYNRLYWSESQGHPRWSLAGNSELCYYDLNTNRFRQLTHGARYYNPHVGRDTKTLIAVEYPTAGGSAVVEVDAFGGKTLNRIEMPAAILAMDAAIYQGSIYLSGLTPEGYGLYRQAADGNWETLLAPSHQKIGNFGAGEDCLSWESDRTGVNELYHYYPEQDKLLQITNSRYGATNYAEDGEYLYSVSQTPEGRPVFRTPLGDLRPKEVSYGDVCSHPIEDKLTAQEQALGAAPDLEEEVPLSAPKPYSRIAHALQLHSWLPLYVNYDAVKEGSMDFSYETASIGLSGFFQNTLGNFSGMLGYALHPDPDRKGGWRNALHLKATYTGLYPVFEFQADLGDEASRQYVVQRYVNQGTAQWALNAFPRRNPLFSASLRTYIPLSFNKGGRLYGFTPQLRYSLSNNLFAPDPVCFDAPGYLKGLPAHYTLSSTGDGSSFWFHRLTGSVRGYYMLPRADSQIYPRLGIGAELGGGIRPGMTDYYAPNLYGYVYGYLPGLWPTQGLKLSAMYQQQMGTPGFFGDLVANTLPRGFSADVGALVARAFTGQWKVTADYAIPIYVGEWSIPGLAYIKNFLLSPHADYTGLADGYDLYSVGADFSASLARLFVLPFDASIGVSFSYLGGTLMEHLEDQKPYSVELIFGVDF